MSRPQNILVTGGTGFVGTWFDWYNREKRNTLYLLGSKEYNAFLWKGFKWDYIIHLAPIAPTEILAIAKRDNARVLYVSSGIVYHPENDTEYRKNKIKWEQECLDSGVDVVIARLFTFYGEKLDEHKAYTQFKKAAEAGEPLRIWGDGKAIRSYMHGSEMARWLWAILLHGESGEVYDVGSDEPITINQLAQKISLDYLEKTKILAPIIIENRTPDPMPVYLPVDTAKTKALLRNFE
jgi:nucleoside-diphosphate-sugar epimerase